MSNSKGKVDIGFGTIVITMTAEQLLIKWWKKDESSKTSSKLLENLDSELILLSSTGVASLLMFKCKVSNLFKLIPSSDQDEEEIGLQKVPHQIVHEVEQYKFQEENFHARVNMYIALNV
jgi:hypothetical protein